MEKELIAENLSRAQEIQSSSQNWSSGELAIKINELNAKINELSNLSDEKVTETSQYVENFMKNSERLISERLIY